MWAQIDREVGVARLGKQPANTERVNTIGSPRRATADVANVSAFWRRKADYLTGQAINVTGGWLCISQDGSNVSPLVAACLT